jgi:hypothetical protein
MQVLVEDTFFGDAVTARTAGHDKVGHHDADGFTHANRRDREVRASQPVGMPIKSEVIAATIAANPSEVKRSNPALSEIAVVYVTDDSTRSRVRNADLDQSESDANMQPLAAPN